MDRYRQPSSGEARMPTAAERRRGKVFDGLYRDALEKLEERVLLAAAATNTGDVALLDLTTAAVAPLYTLVSAEVLTSNASLTFSTDAYSHVQLKHGAETVGTVVLYGASFSGKTVAPAGTSLQTNGAAYFAPATADGLSDDDDITQRGFQGIVRLTFSTGAGNVDMDVTVTSGYSTGGGNAVTINPRTLDKLRAQQRLNYLGFPAESGTPLELSGTVDAATEDSLQLFQAATDPLGKRQPTDALGEIDFFTATWLNAADAPAWRQFSPSLAEGYATSWLVDVFDAAGLTYAGAPVSALSTLDGTGSAPLHVGGTGRLHTAGMEADLALPPAATVADGVMTQEEDDVVNHVLALQAEAAARGLSISAIATRNGDLVTAINDALEGDDVIAVDPGTGASDTMQVGFAAPKLSNDVASNEVAAMLAIIEKLRDMGDAIQDRVDAALELAANSGIPLIEDEASELMDLAATFEQLADRLLEPAELLMTVAPSPLNSAAPVRIQMIVEDRPVEVTINASGNANIGGLIADINAALAAAGIGGDIVAVNNGGKLSLNATAASAFESIAVTTLRVVSGSAGPLDGRIAADSAFTIDLTTTAPDEDGTLIATARGPVTVTLLADATDDNYTLAHLAEDLNDALAEQELSDDLLVRIDPGPTGALSDDKLVFVTINPDVTTITLSGATGLGFADATTTEPVTSATFGIEGLRAFALPEFHSIPQLMDGLAAKLTEVSSEPLPAGFDVDWEYDSDTGALLFNFHFDAKYTNVQPFGFTEPLPIGSFATLEFTARASATVDMYASLDLRLGIDLNLLGSDFVMTGTTPLTTLNGDLGVPYAVGITAGAAAHADGRLAANANISLTIDGVVTLVPVTVASTSTNFSPADLVDDVNDAIVTAGLGAKVEAIYNTLTNRIAFQAIDPTVQTMEVNGALQLGFMANQTGNYNDLVIDVGGTRYFVDLDGAETVQDVIDSIQAATAGPDQVMVSINAQKGLTLTAPAAITVGAAENNDQLSPAALALGIVTGGASPGSTLVGQPLHGQTLGARLFIVEPAAGQTNLLLHAEIRGSDLLLRAGFGEIAVDVTSCNEPYIDFTLPIRFVDPGTGTEDDGRIFIDEIRESDIEDLIDVPALESAFTADLDVCLELGSPILEAASGGNPLGQLHLGLGIPGDFGSFEVDADLNLGDLLGQLKNLTVGQVVVMLQDFLISLNDPAKIPALNIEIPLLGLSLGEVASFSTDLLDALSSILVAVDLPALSLQIDAIDAGIANLAIEPDLKLPLLDLAGTLRGLLSVDPLRLPALLLSISAELRGAFDLLFSVEPHDPLQLELSLAIDGLADLIPSINTLADRLEAEISARLPGLLDFRLGFVDFSADPGMQTALVVGIEANVDVEPIEFEPEIPTAEFGPIAIEASSNFTLHAGGSIGLGLGLNLADLSSGTPEPFIIVRPTAGQEDLIATGLVLSAGFDGAFAGDVSLGAIEAVSADAAASFLAAQEETLPLTPAGAGRRTATLGHAPLRDDERFIIVSIAGTVLSRDQYDLAGTTLTIFTDGMVPLPTSADVTYQWSDVPGSPLDLQDNTAQRATLTVGFDDAKYTPTTPNLINAVPISDLFVGNKVQVDTNGLLTTSLSASFLNATAPDAITIAVGFDHLDQPQIVVDEEAITGLLTNIEFDLCTAATGLEALLSLVEFGLTSEILSKLPMIGGGLDAAGTFAGKLRSGFVTPFRTAVCDIEGTFEEVELEVQDVIWKTLGIDGLNMLGDNNGDLSIDIDDVTVTLDTDHFEVDFKLAGREQLEVDFGTGLSGLPIDAAGQGGVTLGMGYNVDFGFGIDKFAGFYFLTNGDATPEFSVDVDAFLTVNESASPAVPTSLSVNLFGLHLSATDVLDNKNNSTTGFSGSLSLDAKGDAANRLALADIGSMSFGDVFAAELDATAEMNLELEAKVSAALPRISADFCASVGFHVSTGGDGDVNVTIDPPTVCFEHISLDLGDFIGQYVAPVVEKVNEYLGPIKPITDLLTTEIPGVSEMSQLAGKGPITLLDLAFLENPDQAKTVKKFVGVLDQIIEIAGDLAAFSSSSNVIIDFGSIYFDAAGGLDLSQAGWNDPEGSQASAVGDALETGAAGFDLDREIAASGNNAMGSTLNTVEREPDTSGNGGLGLKLDFLDPMNLFKYLIGQPADVVSWKLPRFELGFDWEAEFPVLPIPPISVGVGVNIDAFADLSVGFDTSGILSGDFLDGFYFGDLSDVSTGDDIDEFGFGIGATLSAALDLLIAEAGVQGEIRADALANWRDRDKNGKMYLAEILEIAEDDGLDCVFDLSGKVRAIVRLYYEVLGKGGSLDIADLTLFEVTNSCPKWEPAHVSDGSDTYGDDAIPSGALVIHAGAFAGERGSSATDTHETFTVTQLASGIFRVEGMGLDNTYAGVTSVFFDGGVGNDRIDLLGVSVPATLHGGIGADSLFSGTGADSITGGDGDDTINSSDGNDTIDAGDGIDTITAGQGADSVLGAAGRDSITGGNGNDTLNGGSDNDTIDGGGNNDLIDGEAGVDSLLGQGGNDTINGGTGDDLIYGGIGLDSLTGDEGHDLLDGAEDADFLRGAEGNDLLIGGGGVDTLLGSYGNDVAFAHLVSNPDDAAGDYIEGGPDNDWICGANGIDRIFGGTADLGYAYWLNESNVDPAAGGYTPVSCTSAPTFLATPTATISGQKFHDINMNGLRDADEPGLNGWTIQIADANGHLADVQVTADIDLDGDGVIDPFTESGLYVSDDLAEGDYVVSEIDQAGYTQTYPSFATHTLYLTVIGAEHIDFGNVSLASLSGVKWEDTDGDGYFDADEQPLSGVTVYLDLNNNNALDVNEPFTKTLDAIEFPGQEGTYTFYDLKPGDYTVREEVPDGYTQSWPGPATGNEHAVSLSPGESSAGHDFGNEPLPGFVSGTKYNDLDGDGQKDPQEPGLPGVVVYADLNGNGRLDPGEPRDTTNQLGQYALTDLPQGTYSIREIVPTGWHQTDPAGVLYYENTFDKTIGNEWSQKQTSVAPATNNPFLGQFGNGTVSLNLKDLPAHDGVLVTYDLYVLGRWDGSATHPLGPDQYRFSGDGKTVLNTTFSNTTVTQSFPDAFPGDLQRAQDGAFSINKLGLGVDAVYRMSFILPYVEADLKLDFSALGIDSPGQQPDFNYHFTRFFGDADGDGDVDNTDLAAFRPAFPSKVGQPNYDPRFDAELDGDVDAIDALRFRKNLLRGTLPPSGGVNSPIVTLTNPPGAPDNTPPTVVSRSFTGGALKFQFSEPVTGADVGALTLINLTTGKTIPASLIQSAYDAATHTVTYTAAPGVGTLPDGNYRATLEATKILDLAGNPLDQEPDPNDERFGIDNVRVTLLGLGQQITVTPGKAFDNIDFGNQINSGTVSGVKFGDSNGDGHKQSTEPLIAGITIYADYNDNHALDPGEPFDITDSDNPGTTANEQGQYKLTVRPGRTFIREIIPPGVTPTYPDADGYTVAVLPGNVFHTLDFGNQGQLPGGGGGGGTGGGDGDPKDPNPDPQPNPDGTPTSFPSPSTLGEGQGEGRAPTSPILFASPSTGPQIAAGYSISGTKWEDLDQDGLRDPAEIGLEGVTIFVDFDRDGKFDANEPSTVTGPDGSYTIDGLQQGTYIVREVLPDGSIQTYPSRRFIAATEMGVLVDINIATGLAHSPRATANGLIGLAVDNAGVLYGIASNFLYLIDPITGDETLVRALPGLEEGDAAFDPATNLLYFTWAGGSTLFSLDLTTGVGAAVGNIGTADPSGLAFDHAGNLWTLDFDNELLLRIDKTNASTIQSFPIARQNLGTTAGMDFDPITGKLYAVNGTSNALKQLYTIDTNTGAVINVGPTNVNLSAAQFLLADYHVVTIGDGFTPPPADFGNVAPIYLEDGSDTIYGADGADPIYGDNLVTTDPRVISIGDDDTLFGEGGNDALYGQDEDDELWGQEGSDALDGGEDDDTVRQVVDANQVLTNIQLTGQGTDTLANIEHGHLTGGAANNTINAATFSLGSVTLDGAAGNDTLTGSASADELTGGAGNDSLTGGDGDDVYVFTSSTTPETDTLTESFTPAGGIDRLDFSALPATDAVSVKLNTATALATHLNRTVATTSDVRAFENVTGGAAADTLLGNSINNTLIGNAGNDTLLGDAGDDLLRGGSGSDNLSGGDGNDTFLFAVPTAFESDTLTESTTGLGGVDTLDFTNLGSTDPLVVNLSSPTGLVQIASHTNRTVHSATSPQFENILGGRGDDSLTGNGKANLLDGNGGDDTLSGLDGSDTLEGAAGNDLYVFSADLPGITDELIETGSGIDTLDFSALLSADAVNINLNNANIATHSGRTAHTATPTLFEVAIGGGGNDTLTGNALANVLVGGGGNDSMTGGDGGDTYVFNPTVGVETDEVNELPGTTGDDVLDFSAITATGVEIDLTGGLPGLTTIARHMNGNRTVNVAGFPGGASFEILIGGQSSDRMIGNASANTLIGNDGDDTLDGNDGNDLLEGGLGDDSYVFTNATGAQVDVISEAPNAGLDTLNFTALTTSVTIDLSADTLIASHLNRTVDSPDGANLETILGGSANDTITGSSGDNRIDGGAGADSIDAGLGDDTLIGGAGNDTLAGGGGDDLYLLDNRAETDRLVEDSGSVSAGAASGGGSDSIDFSTFSTAVTFSLATASQPVGLLTLTLRDSDSNNATHFENVLGSALFANSLTGNAADNLLVGGAAGDTLNGAGGNDTLLGNGGADTLDGQAGDDAIVGGNGNDSLLGSAGRDLLIGSAGADTINGGGEEDILVAGFTSHDPNPEALGILLTEWTNTSRAYATRIANLQRGVGAASAFALAPLASVFDDGGDADSLTGGTGLDWFLRKAPNDLITDLGGTETVTPL